MAELNANDSALIATMRDEFNAQPKPERFRTGRFMTYEVVMELQRERGNAETALRRIDTRIHILLEAERRKAAGGVALPARYLCIECGASPSTEAHNRPDGTPCDYLPVRLREVGGAGVEASVKVPPLERAADFLEGASSDDLQTALPDTPTPKAMAGEWALVAPDGRTWKADSPLRVCAAESRERVPADVALARIYRAASEECEALPFDPGYVHAYLTAAMKDLGPDVLIDPQVAYFLEWLADGAKAGAL